MLRGMPSNADFPDQKRKEGRKERKSSSPPREVLPWTFSLASSPKALAGSRSFTWLTKVFRFWFHSGEIFFMFNYQFLKTEMSLVLQ